MGQGFVPTTFFGLQGARQPASLLDASFYYVSAKVVSVLDFGAKVDGVTDDLSAVNTALAAIAAAGGGTLYIPTGTLAVSSSINYGNNTVIVGAGRGATTIKLLSSSALTSSHGIIQPVNYGNGAPASGYYAKNITIAHLSVDGNKAGNAGIYECIVGAAVKDFLCYDCEAFNAREVGFQGSRYAVGTDLQSNIEFVACIAHDNLADGFQIEGATCTACYAHNNTGSGFNSAGNFSGGGDLTNIVTRLTNCEATYNSQYGIVHILQSGASISALFSNCVCNYNTLSGMAVADMNDVSIVNCSCKYNTGAGVDGLYLRGDRVNVMGGQFSNNTRAGVYCDGNRTRVSIQGIIATTNNYGAQVVAPNGGADNFIADCTLTGNTTGAVDTKAAASSTWRITNNLGLNPVGAFGAGGNPVNVNGGVAPATGTTVTNTYGYPVLVTVSGGTVGAIQINGVATGLTSGTFILPPALDGATGPGSITINHTGAPNWQWYGL